MKIYDLKRNLNDFKKEVDNLKSYDDGSFENQSIYSLRSMYDEIKSLCSEWEYLEKNIEDAIVELDKI